MALDKMLLKSIIEHTPIKAAKELSYDVHRLSPKDTIDKGDYERGYRFRLSKEIPSQPYPETIMARSESEIATFLKREIGNNPSEEGGNPMTITGLGISGSPRMGNPKQERERAASHFGVKVIEVTPDMIQKLPPRSTGLTQSDIDYLAERIADKIKEGAFAEDTGSAILILHSIPHMHGSPGIMVDPDIAARTSCKCYDNVCFSRGIIGALDPAQREAYCPTTEHATSPGMTRRLKNWQEAVDVCKVEIEKYEKGERLEPWLSCMSEELPKRGIEI